MIYYKLISAQLPSELLDLILMLSCQSCISLKRKKQTTKFKRAWRQKSSTTQYILSTAQPFPHLSLGFTEDRVLRLQDKPQRCNGKTKYSLLNINEVKSEIIFPTWDIKMNCFITRGKWIPEEPTTSHFTHTFLWHLHCSCPRLAACKDS